MDRKREAVDERVQKLATLCAELQDNYFFKKLPTEYAAHHVPSSRVLDLAKLLAAYALGAPLDEIAAETREGFLKARVTDHDALEKEIRAYLGTLTGRMNGFREKVRRGEATRFAELANEALLTPIRKLAEYMKATDWRPRNENPGCAGAWKGLEGIQRVLKDAAHGTNTM